MILVAPRARRWRDPVARLAAAVIAATAALSLALAVEARDGHQHHTDADSSSDAPAPLAGLASGTATVLGGDHYSGPQLDVTLISSDSDVVDLDSLLPAGIGVLFYFSAGCSHCEAAAPDIERLSAKLGADVTVVSIASGSNSMSAAVEFAQRFGLKQPIYKDFSRQFASRNHASSTPMVLVVRKSKQGGDFETLAEFRPFAPGMSLLIELRIKTALGSDPWASFESGRYYGPKACGACHLVEYKSWGLTHHSVAYWTLYQRERAEDRLCVGCHVTGLDEATGFAVGDHGSPLADVSCEACHGPGGPHDGQRQAASTTCRGCHDQDHSVRFDLSRALPHIDHLKADGMDPASYQAARKTLTEGGAARPLTAFPEGKNLGAQACASCHLAETEHWAKTAHANALQTLKKRAGTRNMDCLLCHAVQRQQPTTPKDYFGDGVACESCHGPGEDHVAAGGGTENILGLTSSCPECIIEAVCTRCHTPEQDPNWDLALDLAKVRHHPTPSEPNQP